MDHNGHALQLPNSVVGVMDINRLDREMASLNDFMHQAAIRESGSPMNLPKMSRLFDEVAQINGLNLLQEQDRAQLTEFLAGVRAAAPRLHISFSVDPSPHFLGRLMEYLRKSIDPFVLVQVGLQPNIGAGCVVRSTNKVFDLSLREDFRQKRSVLMEYVSKLEAKKPEDDADQHKSLPQEKTEDPVQAQQAPPQSPDNQNAPEVQT